MKPILPGGRGPEVEDVQRRLLVLGYDLGPTGVDGVFLGMTRDAVVAFQSAQGLSEDGIVGEETWSALVDETFELGDRMLYLRLPYFHGRDVSVLQSGLNILGFSCGEPDGIFGPFCERAVREFQRSCGHVDDGIVGSETVRALEGLRHVWEGKDPRMPSTAKVAPARTVEALKRHEVVVEGRGDTAKEIAGRMANLALASCEGALVVVGDAASDKPVLHLTLVEPPLDVQEGVPLIALGNDDASALSGRLITASFASSAQRRQVLVDVGELERPDEIECQRSAVRLLDALCGALVADGVAW